MGNLTTRQRTNARALRAAMTDAELLLWYRLRHHQIHGMRFRRQHPVDPYIIDFACVELRIAIELDGGQHVEQVVEDAVRTARLNALGWKVLRYWNHEVLQQRDDVLEDIWRNVAGRLPLP
jgi:very-short-patch-repair endonuclease